MTDPAADAPPALRSHLTNDVRFGVPAGWADRSVHVFTAPPAHAGAESDNGAADGNAMSGAAAAASLTLHADAPLRGEDLAAYAARQLAGLRAALPGLEVLRWGERPVGGGRGWEAEIRWPAAAGAVHQRQVSVLHGGRALTWTLTAPAADYAAHAAAFEAVLASVHLLPAPVTIRVPPKAGRG